MSQNNLPIHNPQTGFADITALPDFSYFFLSPFQIALICLFIACCVGAAFFLYKKLRRPKPPIVINPVQEALGKINQLKVSIENAKNSMSQSQLRLFSSELAEIIRVFLTKKIDFQVIGLTRREIFPELDLNFKPHFPNSPQDILDTLISSIKKLFKETESMTFADKISAEANLDALIDVAINVIHTIDFESQRIAETLPTKS